MASSKIPHPSATDNGKETKLISPTLARVNKISIYIKALWTDFLTAEITNRSHLQWPCSTNLMSYFHPTRQLEAHKVYSDSRIKTGQH